MTTNNADAGADASKTAEGANSGAAATANNTGGAGATDYVIPDQFKGEDGNPNVGAMLARLTEFEAADSTRPKPPEKADDYKIEVPKDLKLPDGTAAEIDVDSEIYQEFRTAAHELGLSQEAFQSLAGLAMKREVGLINEIIAEKERVRGEEMTKLGSKGEARFNAIENWMKSKIGNDAAVIVESLGSAEAIFAFEKLISKIGGSGALGASNTHHGGGKAETDISSLYPTMAKK